MRLHVRVIVALSLLQLLNEQTVCINYYMNTTSQCVDTRRT